MFKSLLLLGRPRSGQAGQALALAKACMARTDRIRRIVSAGGLGWHLSEQVCGLGWGRAALLVFAVLAAVAAITSVAARLRPAIMI